MERLGIWRLVAKSLVGTAMITYTAGIIRGEPLALLAVLVGAWGFAIYAKGHAWDAYEQYDRTHPVDPPPTGWKAIANTMLRELVPVFAGIACFIVLSGIGLTITSALLPLIQDFWGLI